MTDSLTIVNDGIKLVEDAIYAGIALAHTRGRMKYVCARIVLGLIRNRHFGKTGEVLREMELLIPVLVSLNTFAKEELFYAAELEMTIETEPGVVLEFIYHAMEWNRKPSRDFAEFQCRCMINWHEVQEDPALMQ